MASLQHKNPHRATFLRHPHSASVLMITALLLLVFVLSGCSGSLFATSISAAAVSQTSQAAASSATTYPIKVFFSKSPVSLDTDFNAVFPVDRVSPTIAVGTFAIQLLIAGPTPSERSAGYFTELNTLLSGPSNCSAPLPVGGPDFTLTLNKKGSVPETGTATLQFCRTISSPGIGADARVKAEINATLKQFPTITKVVILTKDGHCFADGSGMDVCLR